MKRYFIYFSLFSLISLNANSQSGKKVYYAKLGISEELVANWKKDKQGCQGLRSIMYDSLCKNKKILGLSKCEVLDIFGLPDEYEELVFSYNLKTNCKNGKVDQASDFCQVLFIFNDDGKLDSLNIVCS